MTIISIMSLSVHRMDYITVGIAMILSYLYYDYIVHTNRHAAIWDCDRDYRIKGSPASIQNMHVLY